MSRDPETSAPSSPRTAAPSRRTILTGAAWSVPVIAAASIAPIAAASNAPVLTFDKSTYNGTACSTITGAYVTVTMGGVPTAGQSVTVTLSNGYTFSGGSATYTGVSDGSGKVSLPAISVPAAGGSATLSASNGAVSSNAGISGVSNATAKSWTTGASASTSYGSVPAGSKTYGWNTFLAPNGDLYYGNGRIAQNVTSVVAQHSEQPAVDFITFVSGGAPKAWDSSSATTSSYGSVPTSSTAVGWNTFLAPNGDLYYGNGRIAQNVTSAVAQHSEQPAVDFVSFVSSGAAKVWRSDTASTTSYGTVPNGSRTVGWNGFLAPNGDLYYQNTRLAQNVTSAVAEHQELNAVDFFSFVSGGTSTAWNSSTGAFTSLSSVPSGAKAVGWATFLTGSGDLYYGNTRLAQNVTTAVASHPGPSTDYLVYTQSTPC